MPKVSLNISGFVPSPYQQHVARWKDCQRCNLSQGRQRVALARGKLPCDVLFIGEAPGQSEDSLGVPFIGPAGKLLDHAGAPPGIIQLSKLDQHFRIAFTNLIGCVPYEVEEKGKKLSEPPDEAIKQCASRLKELVRMAKPRLIVLVGKLAKKNVHGQAQFSNREDYELEWLPQGKFLSFIEIIHPAAILRGDVSQRGLAIQRTIATLVSAAEDTFGVSL